MTYNSYRNSKLITVFFLSLLLITSCSKDDVLQDPLENEFVNIPDPYFETALIEQGIDSDGIINQKLLRIDAENVSRLDLNLINNSGDITDLKGIESFTNLTFLSAANQKIALVDLSSNTKLDTLYMLGNYLKNIDLSKNSNLIFVDLQSNEFASDNAIKGLSNALRLKDLDVSWNYLETFSIHNELLEVLHISHNNLKSINTNGATSLKYIYMPLNKLETVDFSSNIALKTLLIAGNKLQYIDLNNNSKLTHLYISDNQLISLDVSNNIILEDLRINDNINLSCIKIKTDQNIPIVWKSEYQQLSNLCN